MGTVKQINQEQNLIQFFDRIFGSQTGYVYSPTKSFDEKQKWEKHFFHWPNEKDKLLRHIIEYTPTHEVYYSPALFKRPAHHPESLTPEHFKGSYYVWAEFDYGVPDGKKLAELGIPEPSIRIRSSDRGNQHWYWRLDNFQTDYKTLEEISKKLAYALEADLSGWDYQQVLRPPTTIHHESNKAVLLLSTSDTYYSPANFDDVPELPTDAYADIKLGAVPDVNMTVLKYAFPEDTADLFRKRVEELNIAKGAVKADRSQALMRLGYDCAQMGMSNEEIYSLLRNADDRWAKFKENKLSDPNRQYKHLIRIIRRARIRYPLTQVNDLTEHFPVFGLVDFLNTNVVIEWVIHELLEKDGLAVISSPPGIGKTQFCLWFAMHIATKKNIFKWKIEKPLKVMFISMEMGHAPLKYIVEQMAENFTEEEKLMLQENLLLVPLGFSVLLDKVGNQDKITNLIKQFAPDGVIFDSLGVAIGDDISSDKAINNTFAYVNKVIRNDLSTFVWFIHHNRKAQANNKQPKKLEDLYGSMYIQAHASTVIGLWRVGNEIEVNNLKLRLYEEFKSFRIKRTQPLGFEVTTTETDTDIKGFTSLMQSITSREEDKGGSANGFGI